MLFATFLLSVLCVWFTSPSTIRTTRAANQFGDVSFDNYTLMLNGERVFLHSGEFHTFRLPVPDLWTDILQKVKAAGLNAISLYTHMGLINPSRGVVDFDDYRALAPFFEAATTAGIWIVLRPGPYINAETTAGGIAHWITSEVAGELRTNASDWRDAWIPYIQGIIEEVAPFQISEGGPVVAIQIDNEYSQSIGAEYFQDLLDYYRSATPSITVPLTYNDPGEGSNFINGTGAVDLYGLDSYPQGFDCSNPLTWAPVTLNYHQYHEQVNPSQPWYFPEFQGGSFDAWGPNAPGYGPCQILTGPDFMSVFYRQLWASNAKLLSYYMFYGGTSWGGIPFPGVYTSYDYGAALEESRFLTPKYDEFKLQGHFIRSSPEFYKTDWISDSSTGLNILSNTAAFVTFLQNPDTKAGFYIIRQNDSTSTAITSFTLTLPTGVKLPQVASSITLSGRQSKVLTASYTFGTSSLLDYSTADIFFSGIIDGRDVLFLYGDSDQEHELSLPLTGVPSAAASSNFATTTQGNSTIVSFTSGVQGLVTVYDSSTQLVLFADTVTASTFWAPMIPDPTAGAFANFWDMSTTKESVLIGGPYLVRNATLENDGALLALTGDLNTTTETYLTVVAPSSVQSITWNGEDVGIDLGLVAGEGYAMGKLNVAVNGTFDVPVLGPWKFNDSLPEIIAGFDDSTWVVANETTTNIPIKPVYGDGRILYGCDYGFCENSVLWRGHFNGTGDEKSVNLSINGGEAFAATVWLNDIFLNTSFGNSSNNDNIIEETDETFTFPDGAVIVGGDNVITVLQDNMGLDESEGDDPDSSKSPRGIRGFQLNTGNFSEWRVQGKVGGYLEYPDKVRGIFNEGGLFGERQGWHLPGFDTSSWVQTDNISVSGAGVRFFVTTFDLNFPEGYDVAVSFTFTEPLGQAYRAYLFVNGWMMGERVGNLGPQAKFPVHEGILEYQETNTVAVAVWAMEDTPMTPQLELTLDAVVRGGVGKINSNNPGWSAVGRSF